MGIPVQDSRLCLAEAECKSGKGWFLVWDLDEGNAEICLLATKGKPRRKSARVHQFFISPLRGHSQKPDEAREKNR